MPPIVNYPGTQDRFTNEILLRSWILGKFQEIYQDLGYNLVETPNLEPSEILAKSEGVGEQPTFVFQDSHRDPVCLKPDQTVSLRRVVEQHNIRLPFRRNQVGFAFRQDKPEKGRFREFLQCDADIIGAPIGIADAETVLWLHLGFKNIGLGETLLFVNSRNILKRLYELLDDRFFDEVTFTRAIDKLPIDGDTDAIERYLKSGHGKSGEPAGATVYGADVVAAVSKVVDLVKALNSYRELGAKQSLAQFKATYPALAEAVAELETVVDYALAMGVSEDGLRFDPCLARGMDYYTGPVFEARHPDWPHGSLAGGGRYDRMIKIREEPQPAVGASFGLDRIELTLNDLGRLPKHLVEMPLADAMVATRPDWMPGPLSIAEKLRKAGKRVLVFPDPGASLKGQTKFASENGIKVVVFYGPDEQDNGTATIRIITDETTIVDPNQARQNKNVSVPIADLVSEVERLSNSSSAGPVADGS